jgi:hypothetical protein
MGFVEMLVYDDLISYTAAVGFVHERVQRFKSSTVQSSFQRLSCFAICSLAAPGRRFALHDSWGWVLVHG